MVADNQSSFIARRHITDNIVIAQEMVHSLQKMQGRKGWMLVKIDLEKAYDRLHWELIYDTLLEACIPQQLVDIFIRC